MKRILPLFLLLALLCGCEKTVEPPVTTVAPPTTGATIPATQPPPVDIYIPDSSMEQITSGAMRQYALDTPADWVAPFDNGILLAQTGEDTVLSVLSGPEGTVTATARLPIKLTEDTVWQSLDKGFAYYLPESREVVFLDQQLTETNRLQLPETITADPVIAPDGSEVFYCVGQSVNAMDAMRKVVRPLRNNACLQQTLVACYQDGKTLKCLVQNEDEQWSQLYISTETGETVSMENAVKQLDTAGDLYFAVCTDGTVTQYLFGTADGTPQLLDIPGRVYPVLELNGVLGITEEAENSILSFYDLATGKKTAAISLAQPLQCKSVTEDTAGGGIWLLTEDDILLYWTLGSSAVTEETVYIGTIYTAEAPDTEGLKQCASRGDALGNEHGVVIRVWERALVSNDAYTITAEYQTEAINNTLDELETVFAKFPENFLYKSVSGQIRVCIVRDIFGQLTSAYHWVDGDPFIILSAGMDIEAAFLEAFSHILDIHVLGNSPIVDDWASLNPEGFAYGSEDQETAYLEGEKRVFTDSHAMESVTDDRASVFYYAMQKDNAEMFQSETMQAKLLMLCQAIRDAWRLEKKTETYLWEQYLNQSLAYQG